METRWVKIQLNNNKLSWDCINLSWSWKDCFMNIIVVMTFDFFLHPRSGNDTKMAEALADKGDLNEQQIMV